MFTAWILAHPDYAILGTLVGVVGFWSILEGSTLATFRRVCGGRR